MECEVFFMRFRDKVTGKKNKIFQIPDLVQKGKTPEGIIRFDDYINSHQ